MAKTPIDWEAIEREYRAGVLSVSEVGRLHGCTHTAINKRAKKYGWLRDLAKRVREEVSIRLVSDEVSNSNAETAIDAAASRGVEVVRSHRRDISIGRTLVGALMAELIETNAKLGDIEDAIEEETTKDTNGKRRALMHKAVALPSRAGVIKGLSEAMKNLVCMERQAFGLDAKNDDDDQNDIITRIQEGRRRAAAREAD